MAAGVNLNGWRGDGGVVEDGQQQRGGGGGGGGLGGDQPPLPGHPVRGGQNGRGVQVSGHR